MLYAASTTVSTDWQLFFFLQWQRCRAHLQHSCNSEGSSSWRWWWRKRRKNQGDRSGDINHLLLADLASRKPTGTGNWPEDEWCWGLWSPIYKVRLLNLRSWWGWWWKKLTHRTCRPWLSHRRTVLRWQQAPQPQLRGRKNQTRPFSSCLSTQLFVRSLT